MKQFLFAAICLCGLASAAPKDNPPVTTTVIDVWLPPQDDDSGIKITQLTASIATVRPEATTYVMCYDYLARSKCDYDMYIASGPKTFEMYNTKEIFGLKATMKCSLDKTISAACTQTAISVDEKGKTKLSLTEKTTFTEKSDMKPTPLTITAGAEKLAGVTGGGTSTPTGGMPRMTGSRELVVGGMAVAAAFAAL